MISAHGPGSDLAALSWEEFAREWECACVEAWEANQQEPTCTLPLNVFPHVSGIVNPCTGTLIPIFRMSPFGWDTSRCACGGAVVEAS